MNFNESVYKIVATIPCGKVCTYGQIAKKLGKPKASRIVGFALHNNPYPIVIPCHRVVNRFGYVASGFAFGGVDIQKALLESEGVIVDSNNKVDLNKYLINL